MAFPTLPIWAMIPLGLLGLVALVFVGVKTKRYNKYQKIKADRWARSSANHQKNLRSNQYNRDINRQQGLDEASKDKDTQRYWNIFWHSGRNNK